MQKLADHGTDFLREAVVTPELICKLVPWDLASQDDLKAVAAIIMGWRLNVQRAIGLTPRGGHRAKQQNTMPTLPRAENTSLGNVQGIAQPSFSPARMQRGRPGAMAAVAELCKHRLLAIQTFLRRQHPPMYPHRPSLRVRLLVHTQCRYSCLLHIHPLRLLGRPIYLIIQHICHTIPVHTRIFPQVPFILRCILCTHSHRVITLLHLILRAETHRL